MDTPRCIRRLGTSVRPVPRQAPPTQHGCARGRGISDASRGSRQGVGLDPEPGEEGAAIFYRQVLEINEPWLTDVAAADIDPRPVSSGAATATKKYCSGA